MKMIVKVNVNVNEREWVSVQLQGEAEGRRELKKYEMYHNAQLWNM